MAQYLDKDALVAEIEKAIKIIYAGREYVGIPSDEESMVMGLQKAEDIINALEVKEVDLEKEIKHFTMSKELYEADSVIKAVAEHFFELGLKSQKGE